MTETRVPEPTSTGSTLLWRAYAKVYDRLWDTPLTERLGDRIADLSLPDQVVVEVGAGTGLVTGRLVARGLRVEAAEPDPSMAVRFRRRLPDQVLTEDSLERLARRSRGPATVVAANVLHLTDDPERGLAALRDLAGPEGRVVVATPVAGATVARAATSHREAGAGWWHTVMFFVGHLALAPLSARTAAARQRGFAWAPDGEEVERVGVCRILVFPGAGPEPSAPVPTRSERVRAR